jgi:glycerate kinase
LGEHGAAKIFAPQKGADAEEVSLLERALSRVRELVLDCTGRDMGNIERGGAAGGIAAAFSALIDAELVNGIDYYLDKTDFDSSLAKANLVITGEGSIDDQTMEGKAPFGVAIRAKQKNISIIGMGGQVGSPISEALTDYFARLIAVNKPGESLTESMLHTEENLRQASEQLGKWLRETKR